MTGTKPDLAINLQSINEYFIGHSLYVDDTDEAIIDKYVSALHVVRADAESTSPYKSRKAYLSG